MKCQRCNENMDKMTVCHQICPNCGAVVDCSDGVFDWSVLDVRNNTTVLGKNVVTVLQSIIQKHNPKRGRMRFTHSFTTDLVERTKLV